MGSIYRAPVPHRECMPLFDAHGREISTADMPPGFDVYYHTPDIPPLTGWDVATAKAAADAHDQGDFETSGRLYWAMLSDSRVADGVGKHALAVRGLPHKIEAGKGQAAKTVAARWEQVLPRALPDKVQSELWSQALLPGLGVAQVRWEYDYEGPINPRTGRPWYAPCVEPWEPTCLAIRRDFSARSLLSQNKLYAKVWGSERDEGRVEDVEVRTGTGQWLCFALAGASKPWLFGKLRTLWRPWISRQMAGLLWLRFNDVHGLPIRAFKVPMGMRKTPETQAMYNSIKNIGRDAALLLPQQSDGKLGGADLEFKEAVGESWKSLQAMLYDYGTEITIDLTGGTQNTEATGGNYKGAEEQREIRHEVKAAGARAWQAFINEQLSEPFAVLNGYGEEEAASLVFDVEPPANEKADAEADKAGGEALQAIAAAAQALRAAGYEVPVEELAASMGRTLPPGKRVAVQVPQAAPEKPTSAAA